MIRFIKWIFNCSEYGYMTYDPRGLYRRRIRSGVVEVKNYDGWQLIHASLWMRFSPHDSDIQEVQLPNGKRSEYSVTYRNAMGEKEFYNWLNGHRQRILEQMIREKYK